MIRQAKLTKSLLPLSVLVLVLSPALVAQASQSEEMQVEGTVITINDDSLVLETEAGEQTFVIDDKSMLPDVAVEGGTLYATYRDIDGTLHLTGISVDESSDVAVNEQEEEQTQATSQASSSEEVAQQNEQQENQVASLEEQPDAANSESSTRELPSTASHLPLFAVIGALAVVAGLAIRRS